jgi:hypothetical protein
MPPIRSKKLPLEVALDVKEMLEEQTVKEPGRKKMRQEFKEGKMVPPLHPETMGSYEELRKKIMMMSLFPNTVNTKFLMKNF